MTPIPKSAMPVVEYIRENVERPPTCNPFALAFALGGTAAKFYIDFEDEASAGAFFDWLCDTVGDGQVQAAVDAIWGKE